MNARNFVKHEFCDNGGVEAGLHGEIAEQTSEESLRVAMYVAAEAPFQGLRADRVSCLQSVANALPQVRLTEGLERLNIAMNPFVVMKGNDPFAIVDKDGRMRLTRNVPKGERERVLAYDVTNLKDEARLNRISFYLAKNKLSAPVKGLPALEQETRAMLQGKCVAGGLALPMLRTGGADFPIFDDSETVTSVKGQADEINPKIYADKINPEIYDENLEYGVLLPLSGAFVAGLNDGSITRFRYRVQRNGDNALKISVTFTLEGEVITHTTTRRSVPYNGTAFAVCSFGQFGAFLLCNDSKVTVSPAEESLVPYFREATWHVSRVRGGVRYVSIAKEGTSLGVVELPDGPKHHEGHPSVTLAYDLGDTSFAGVFYTDPGNPIPVQFNCAQDVRPLVIATQEHIRMLCDGSWFPVDYNGTARSISQMFRDVDGNSFASPAPYMVARPFMQTVLDYFTLDLNQDKSSLLQSLICFKDLLVEDIILRQASRFYTENDFAEDPLYLLRLGNGSRCVDLFCGEETPFNHSRDKLREVLRERAAQLINQNAKLQVIHNRNPKTEVTNGLSCYNADNDGAAIERWQDAITVESTTELSDLYLNDAVTQMEEVANWLKEVVPQICGAIQPLYSFKLERFSQLLESLNSNRAFRAVLLNTINDENGRFGNVYRLSASMAVDIWVAFAIMDHVNRELAKVQVEVMYG